MKQIFEKIKNHFKNVVIPAFTNIQWLEIPVATYVRWVLTFVVSINTLATYLGFNPISVSETSVYMVVSALLNIGVLLVNTYENNSTSKEALIADKVMKALKAASKSDKETAIGKVQDILKELNGEDYIEMDHTNTESEETNSDIKPE